MVANTGFGQSTRLVLLEEFTGETCVPCFLNNPGLNALLDSKDGEVISLKYQNNIPSTGPNLYAYNIPDVTNRTTFYSNTYSPHAFIDGNFWNGNAGAVTGSQIDTRHAVTSSFDVIASHSFSSGDDTIFTHVVIRATQAVSSSTLRARVAVAERDVYGYTSVTGEDHFQHVMRKLLPDGNGTVLPSVWAIGDSVVLDLSWAIVVPTGTIIDKPLWPMLEVIAWVQSNTNKEIFQTGHSPAQVLVEPNLTSVINFEALSCAGQAAPDLVVRNGGSGTINSLDIEYSLDNQTPSLLNWVGTILPGAVVNITMPGLGILPGAHSLKYNITTVNGLPDQIPTNNSFTVPVSSPLTASTVITQDFSSNVFPPVGWLIENPDFFTGWKRITANGGCAKVDFYNSPSGEIDYLYDLTPADLSAAVSPSLAFDVAHKQIVAQSNDRLEVIVSTDCGQSWTSVWNKSGATLASVTGYQTSPYTPGVSHWRAESVDLSAYAGQQSLLIAFKGTSNNGNNAFIDNINLLNAVVGISETGSENLISVYPLPSNGNLFINVAKIKSEKMTLTVTGITGKTVKEFSMLKSGDLINLDLTDLENGSYILKINTGEQSLTKKIVIQK